QFVYCGVTTNCQQSNEFYYDADVTHHEEKKPHVFTKIMRAFKSCFGHGFDHADSVCPNLLLQEEIISEAMTLQLDLKAKRSMASKQNILTKMTWLGEIAVQNHEDGGETRRNVLRLFIADKRTDIMIPLGCGSKLDIQRTCMKTISWVLTSLIHHCQLVSVIQSSSYLQRTHGITLQEYFWTCDNASIGVRVRHRLTTHVTNEPLKCYELWHVG
ncbi:hypothetical protein AZE42_06481, partial [Rhizopogon vesiculosus]